MEVDVRRTGRRFDARARVVLQADARTVWETITDYPGLPRFMPGIRACRVSGHEPAPAGFDERLVVEQQGEFRFLLFAQAMTVLLHIDHAPLRCAHARAVRFELGLLGGGAIALFEGRYDLEGPARGPTVLHYTAAIGLKLPPPPGIGHVAVQHNLGAQLQAVADEVHRRAADRAGARRGKADA